MSIKVMLVDDSPSNVLPAGPAGAALDAGELVYMDASGIWQKAQSVLNTATSRKDAIGVMWKDAQANEVVAPARCVRYRDTSKSFTIGSKVYLSDTAGGLTQTEPTTKVRQVIGFANTATEVFIAVGAGGVGGMDVGGDQNSDSLTLASTLAVGTNASVGGTLGVTGLTTLTGGASIGDGADIAVGTTTGTVFGTAAGEKVGFHGTAGTIQRANASQAVVTATAVTAVLTTASLTTAAHGFATGTQADSIVARVNQLVTDMGNVETLLNELRASLVAKGLIKGSA